MSKLVTGACLNAVKITTSDYKGLPYPWGELTKNMKGGLRKGELLYIGAGGRGTTLLGKSNIHREVDCFLFLE